MDLRLCTDGELSLFSLSLFTLFFYLSLLYRRSPPPRPAPPNPNHYFFEREREKHKNENNNRQKMNHRQNRTDKTQEKQRQSKKQERRQATNRPSIHPSVPTDRQICKQTTALEQNTDEMEHDLQLWNTRIKVQDVQNEEKNRNATRNVIQTSWNAELKCYENGARQQPHPTNRFFDPRIFPYDKSCSLLLDMYLCVEGEFPYKIPFYVEEFARRNDDVVLEEGYLPNSAYAIWASLVPLPRAEAYSLIFIGAVNDLEEQQQQQQRLIQRGGEDGKNNTRNNSTIWISSSDNALACDFSYLDSWLDGLSSEMYQWVTCDGYDKGNDLQNGEEKDKRRFNINETQFRNDYFQGLPSIGSLPKGVRTKVLLKLLKHSMSEIQRDHRLSRAVLLALVEYQCLDGHDGVEAFRYFLLTIESEFIHDCDEDCQHGGADESDDDDSSSGATVGHVCSDVSISCTCMYLCV